MATITTLLYDDVEVYIRESDNYVDATKVCQSKGKLFGNWYRLKSTKDLIAQIYFDVPEDQRATMPVPVEIVQGSFVKGGSMQEQGTWLHPDLAIALAAWLNPKFHIWMLRVTRKLLTKGSVHLNEEAESLKLALGKLTGKNRDLENELHAKRKLTMRLIDDKITDRNIMVFHQWHQDKYYEVNEEAEELICDILYPDAISFTVPELRNGIRMLGDRIKELEQGNAGVVIAKCEDAGKPYDSEKQIVRDRYQELETRHSNLSDRYSKLADRHRKQIDVNNEQRAEYQKLKEDYRELLNTSGVDSVAVHKRDTIRMELRIAELTAANKGQYRHQDCVPIDKYNTLCEEFKGLLAKATNTHEDNIKMHKAWKEQRDEIRELRQRNTELDEDLEGFDRVGIDKLLARLERFKERIIYLTKEYKLAYRMAKSYERQLDECQLELTQTNSNQKRQVPEHTNR